MADKIVSDALKNIDKNTSVIATAMLSPYNPTLDNNLPKERAINPMAMRPPGANVTLTNQKEVVKVIKNLFGF